MSKEHPHAQDLLSQSESTDSEEYMVWACSLSWAIKHVYCPPPWYQHGTNQPKQES